MILNYDHGHVNCTNDRIFTSFFHLHDFILNSQRKACKDNFAQSKQQRTHGDGNVVDSMT